MTSLQITGGNSPPEIANALSAQASERARYAQRGGVRYNRNAYISEKSGEEVASHHRRLIMEQNKSEIESLQVRTELKFHFLSFNSPEINFYETFME